MSQPKRKVGRPPRCKPNPKKILEERHFSHLAEVAKGVRYGGVGYHKKNAADYPDLTPPIEPRPGKSLCDGVRPVLYKEALSLLKSGISRAIVGERWAGGCPNCVWAVSEDNLVFEAKSGKQKPNHNLYHGYQLQDKDPMREEILRLWEQES